MNVNHNRNMSKLLYVSIICNLLTIIPYYLYMLIGIQGNYWPLLVFYLMMFTANFWVALFGIEIQNPNVVFHIILWLGALGSILGFFAEMVPIVELIGAFFFGVCVNYIAFVRRITNMANGVTFDNKRNLLQVFITFLASTGFVLLGFRVKSSILFLAIGLLIVLAAFFSKPAPSREKESWRRKPAFRYLPILVFLSGGILVLKMSRSSAWHVWGVAIIVACCVCLIWMLYEAFKTIGRSFGNEEHRFYSLVQGAMSSISLLYASFIILMSGTLKDLIFQFTLPLFFAIIFMILLGKQLVKIPFKDKIFGFALLNILATGVLLIPHCIGVGVFLSYANNLMLAQLITGVYFLSKKEIPQTYNALHGETKKGSLLGQIMLLFFYLIPAMFVATPFEIMQSLGGNATFNAQIFLSSSLGVCVVISLIALLWFGYKGRQQK